MDIKEEEDPVISEIPVYLCKELSQLHLFQFPCRAADTSTCTKNIACSRVKPQSGIIELNCLLDTKSPYYDFYVGEQLGSNISGDNDDEEKLLDKLTLRSQRSILKQDTDSFCVAGIYDGKFCISTLKDTHSFLPTHEHKEKVKKSNAKDTPGSESEDDPEEGISSAVPITVKFTHKNNDRTKISQEQSHYQHLVKTAEEAWCNTSFYNSTSSTAMKKMEGLTKAISRNRTAMMSLNEKQYLEILIPGDTSDLVNVKSK